MDFESTDPGSSPGRTSFVAVDSRYELLRVVLIQHSLGCALPKTDSKHVGEGVDRDSFVF